MLVSTVVLASSLNYDRYFFIMMHSYDRYFFANDSGRSDEALLMNGRYDDDEWFWRKSDSRLLLVVVYDMCVLNQL